MYTIKEVADKFSVHPNTVRKWIKNKTLEIIRKGNVIRISDEAIDRFKGE